MKLTEHFDLAEMTVSQAAARLGIKNTPNAAQLANLKELCTNVLEPLREAANGLPVIVTSGFRSEKVNSLVGGSKTSDHMDGRAADIIIPGLKPLEVCQLIVYLNLPYKQVIHEFREWTHVSIPNVGETPKREQLTAKRQGHVVVYMKGLV